MKIKKSICFYLSGAGWLQTNISTFKYGRSASLSNLAWTFGQCKQRWGLLLFFFWLIFTLINTCNYIWAWQC